MTARQQIRVGSRVRDREHWDFETQRAPRVGELLVVAREKKGITLDRAERDTKIRARHLAALENDDAAALPAAVYAKGFLRNYAVYLGLDPDEMVMRWRTEQEPTRPAPIIAIEPPPQPISAPGRRLLLTPGVIVAGILVLVVLAFASYVGLQLVRFSQNPEVILDGPSVIRMAPGSTTLTLAGGGTPSALVNVTGADDLLRTATADARGRWSVEVPVSKGRNDFSVVARDPETGRETAALPVIANVPVDPDPGTTTPASSLLPGMMAAGVSDPGNGTAVLALAEPAEGTTAVQGRLDISGATDAPSVLVTARAVGRGQAGVASEGPAPLTLRVDAGAFSGRLVLPEGKWDVTVETVEPEARDAAAVTRRVRSEYEGLVVVVNAVDGFARIRGQADGEDLEPVRLEPGQKRVYRADQEIVLRTGNRQATVVTQNGRPLGAMGEGPGPAAWRLEQGQPPTPLD